MPTRFSLALVLFFLFLLSDIYYQGVGRALDYAAIVVCAFWLQTGRVSSVSGLARKITPPLFIVALPWIIAGLVNDNALASLAILAGLIFVFPIALSLGSHPSTEALDNAIKAIVVVNFSLLFLQLFLHHVLGIFIDFPAELGAIESRGFNESLGYFRASGLFQEPNAYCAAMFCLLVLAMTCGKRNLTIELVGIASMAASQSLWGFAGAGILLWMSVGLKRAFVCILALSAVVIVFFAASGISATQIIQESVTMTRILNIEDDPSRQARYGSVENIVFDLFLVIGHGVDTSNFQQIAANGLAFSLYSFGLLGCGLLLLYFFGVIGQTWKIWAAVIFALSTFPLFSYMYFWFWLGVIVARRRRFRTVSKRVNGSGLLKNARAP